MRLDLWHGSQDVIESFDPTRTADGGFHLGTEAQARMRNSRHLHRVTVELNKVGRTRDRGGDWRECVAKARRQGFSAVVYLNRYEGLTTEVIDRLAGQGKLSNLDELSDAAFRKLVPEAQDSFIAVDPDTILAIVLEESCSPSIPGEMAL